jgi:hypothetical protein
MSDQQVVVNGRTKNFQFSESAACWMGSLEVGDRELPLEIYLSDLKAPDVEWKDVEDFCYFIGGYSALDQLLSKSEKILMHFIDTIRFGIDGDIEKYSFKLAAVFYKGKRSAMIFDKPTHQYSLMFRLYRQGYVESDDPYGLYFVDVDNALIHGVRRQQA